MYEHTAKIYLLIIIAVLSACILIFAGADRLAGALFKTAAEREVEAMLRQSAIQMLRNLSVSAEKLQTQSRAQDEAVPPSAPAAGAAARPLVQATPAWPATGPNSTPTPPNTSPGVPAMSDVPRATGAEADKNPSADEALRRTVKQLYEENATLQQKLMEARDRLGEEVDRLAVEEVRRGMAIELAQIRATADDHRADADRDIAQAKVDAERDVAQDLNALIASSVARVGAAVIVVLLVRIFLRDRQRLVLLGGFYVGLADALEISGGDPARLKEWLPQLVPPAMASSDDVATPIETVMQAVVELAKRNRS